MDNKINERLFLIIKFEGYYYRTFSHFIKKQCLLYNTHTQYTHPHTHDILHYTIYMETFQLFYLYSTVYTVHCKYILFIFLGPLLTITWIWNKTKTISNKKTAKSLSSVKGMSCDSLSSRDSHYSNCQTEQ